MLSVSSIMLRALEYKIVIPAFNVPYPEVIEPIVEALRDTESFGLIEVARPEWEKFGAKSLEVIREVYEQCKDERFTRVHLDHIPVIDEDKKSVDYLEIIRRAISVGYDSVMVDGSRLSLEENIAATRSVVDIAHDAGIPVEAELGAVVGHEEGPAPSYEELYASGQGFTDSGEAAKFVRETGADWLSVSFGNVHGAISKAKRSETKIAARLNIAHLDELRRVTNIPLVLHGGSGIPRRYIQEAIAHGICKINIGTTVRQVYEKALEESQLKASEAVYRTICQMLRKELKIVGKSDIVNPANQH